MALELAFIGPFEHLGLIRSGPVGPNYGPERVPHLLAREVETAVGQRVEERGGGLSVELANPVLPRVRQRVQQGRVRRREGRRVGKPEDLGHRAPEPK